MSYDGEILDFNTAETTLSGQTTAENLAFDGTEESNDDELSLAEQHQTQLEQELRAKAIAALYAKPSDKTITDEAELSVTDYFDLDKDSRTPAHKLLSESGDRDFASSFIAKNISKVVNAIKDEIELLEMASQDDSISTNRSLLELLPRITNNIDYEVIALIGLSNVLLGVQTGERPAPAEAKITRLIGKETEFEAFRAYLDELDPTLLGFISKRGLTDTNTQKNKRISGFIQTVDDIVEVEWEWLSNNDQLRLGRFIRDCVFEATGCFEYTKPFGSNGHRQYAIVLNDYGVANLEMIMKSVEESVTSTFPMIVQPKHWNQNGQQGGYYTVQPYPLNVLVRNSMGSIMSIQSINAVNRLQNIGWQINTFIFNIQKQLLETNCEIGSFRGFNAKLYENVDNPLILDPEDLRYSWDDENLSEDEIKSRNKAYAISKLWESEKDLNSQKSINPRRVVSAVEKLLNMEFDGVKYDTFYLPWFMDNRSRCYPMVDTLNCQGSDYQKALMLFATGIQKSAKSKKDLLISIATTYGNRIDKLSYLERLKWARSIRTLMPMITADPLAESSKDFWTKADEPFQFLALCHEYVNLFIKRIYSTHHVSGGRDATCSGIQITGAMLKDERTCSLVNVLPSSEPQDAYNDVAHEARSLLKDPDWMMEAYEKNEENRKNRHFLWIKEFQELLADGKRRPDQAPPCYERITYEESIANIDEWLPFIDRSVAKMPTMLIPYGGSFLTIFGHVKDKLKEKGAPIPNHLYVIITKSLIQGMDKSLPAFSAVNSWFQSLAKAALSCPRGDGESPSIRWETPIGSQIVQEYHNPITRTVRTYGGDATNVRAYNSIEDDPDNLNNSKMRTALAANVVHSIDASIIQGTVNYIIQADPDTPFTAVHDCIYGPSGVIDELQVAVRKAFYENVRENITKQIAEENLPGECTELLETLPVLKQGTADVSLKNILKSEYLFS